MWRADAEVCSGGSGISIVNVTNPKSLNLLRTYTFVFTPPAILLGSPSSLAAPSASPKRPFVHQVVLDPTGKFMMAPDLSADLVHVFGLDENGLLTDPIGQMPLGVNIGSGPRHLAFYRPAGDSKKTYVYLVLEVEVMLHGYEVIYTEKGTLEFKKIYTNTLWGGDKLPAGATAAEIAITVSRVFPIRIEPGSLILILM